MLNLRNEAGGPYGTGHRRKRSGPEAFVLPREIVILEDEVCRVGQDAIATGKRAATRISTGMSRTLSKRNRRACLGESSARTTQCHAERTPEAFCSFVDPPRFFGVPQSQDDKSVVYDFLDALSGHH